METFKEFPLDNLIVTDIYAASEKPIATITAERFARELEALKPGYRVTYIPYDTEFNGIKNYLDSIVQPDDLILLQGAGKINKCIQKLKSETSK